jgi:hypothetical protein
MQRLFQDKRAVLSVSILALLSLVLLAGSLKDMDFHPGEPLGVSRHATATETINLGELIGSAAEIPFWKQVAFLALLFAMVVLATLLLSPERRKQLIYAFIRVSLFALAFLYFVKKNPDLFAGILKQLSIPGDLTSSLLGANKPVPVFQPPQISGWFSYMVALVFVLLIVLFLWWLYRGWTRMKEMSSKRKPLDEIARIARMSLSELQSGRNFENAILECYTRMSTVVDERKGLHREMAMTPAEFAMRLARAGLPREPVESLTHLFEAVRYGGQHAGQPEINEAVLNLTSILRYCGEEA